MLLPVKSNLKYYDTGNYYRYRCHNNSRDGIFHPDKIKTFRKYKSELLNKIWTKKKSFHVQIMSLITYNLYMHNKSKTKQKTQLFVSIYQISENQLLYKQKNNYHEKTNVVHRSINTTIILSIGTTTC